MDIRSYFVLITALLACSWGIAVAEPVTAASGAPECCERSVRPAPLVPAGMDDMLRPLDEPTEPSQGAPGVSDVTALGSDTASPRWPSRMTGDVRIGAPRELARTVSLDFDEETGNLFSVVRWGSTTGDSNWSVNISEDHGATWTETFSWTSTIGILDVDAAVVGEWLYVGYVTGGQSNQLRVRRCRVADGAIDVVYGYHVALDVGTNTLREIAATANADDYDNRIYFLAIESNNALRFVWDVGTDGTTFEDESPVETPNAFRGLSASYSNGFDCDAYLYASYLGTDNSIHVRGRTTSWSDRVVETGAAGTDVTSISVFEQVVICAFEKQMTYGEGISYRISYDCGSFWSSGDIAAPAEGSGDMYLRPSVDARNGLGTAIIYQGEMGEPDEVYVQYRIGFAPGMWEDAVAFNDNDVVTGTDTMLRVLSHGATYMDHGAIYVGMPGAVPYFDRVGPAVSAASGTTDEFPSLQILPAYPNPFGDRTTIRFVLPEPSQVRLQVFDVLGRHVATLLDGPLDAGMHAIPLSGQNLGSEVYFYRIVAGTEEKQSRIIAIR